jgi:hypothetical protein
MRHRFAILTNRRDEDDLPRRVAQQAPGMNRPASSVPLSAPGTPSRRHPIHRPPDPSLSKGQSPYRATVAWPPTRKSNTLHRVQVLGFFPVDYYPNRPLKFRFWELGLKAMTRARNGTTLNSSHGSPN